jgi:hypothetical protein
MPPVQVTNFVESPLHPPHGYNSHATPIKTQYNTNYKKPLVLRNKDKEIYYFNNIFNELDKDISACCSHSGICLVLFND